MKKYHTLLVVAITMLVVVLLTWILPITYYQGELVAGERTCVCKHGYVRENGVCTKQKVECSSNKEPGADGVTCVCRADYKKSDGTCSTTKISKEDSKLDDDTTDDENNTKQDDTTNSNDDDNNTSKTETDNNTDNDNTEVIENEE